MSTKPRRSGKRAAPGARRRVTAPQGKVQAALAGLAHEVRTPLNGILVLAELLAVSDLPAREREWAASLKSAAEHLANLTTIVVDGARAGSGALTPRRQPFDVRANAEALGRSLEARAAAKGLAATVGLADTLPRSALGDPVLLRAAVENLVDNAVKFTERGAIAFSAQAEPAQDGRVRLTFTVTDGGIGISAAALRRLFRPFAQASRQVARRFGGAGLGLAFARQVARALGGDLTAESAPGKGSRFCFQALVEKAPPDLGAAAAGPTTAADGRALRILCAEDNPYGRVMFNTMAAALGHRIDFVTSGEAAVEAARTDAYDLVLMDVTLPGMNGIEATRRIRALAGLDGPPVIGISGRGDAAEESAGRAAGMASYLVKPVSPSALASVIAATLRR